MKGGRERKNYRNTLKGLIPFLLLLAALPLAAADSAEVVYAEGEGLTLIRNGESIYYDVYLGEADGLALEPGDLVLTEGNTWVEILLNESGTVIKVAENTTFFIKSIQDACGVFEVSYGRVRARVEKLTRDTPFWMGGGDTVAGVRGTDFGYDLFYDAASPEKKSIRVYCFDGEVEVVRRMDAPEGEDFVPDDEFSTGKEYSSTVLLRQNEMVAVDSEKSEDLRKQRVEPDIKDFWETNEFIYVPAESEEAGFSFESFNNDARELRQAGIITVLSGSLIAAGGAASYYLADSTGTAIGLGTVGGTMIIAGGYFLIRSFILEQSLP